MQAAFLRQRPDFTVISYGNGTAYAFEHKTRTQRLSVFLQGDDATRFREELETAEEIFGDTDEALARLWRDYAAAAS